MRLVPLKNFQPQLQTSQKGKKEAVENSITGCAQLEITLNKPLLVGIHALIEDNNASPLPLIKNKTFYKRLCATLLHPLIFCVDEDVPLQLPYGYIVLKGASSLYEVLLVLTEGAL